MGTAHYCSAQPEGFEYDKPNLVCKLKKSLYGLKQSAHNWQKLLVEIMTAQGFYPINADPCVYTKRLSLHEQFFFESGLSEGHTHVPVLHVVGGVGVQHR